jgi:S1-C subfamily serine protease
MDRATLEKVKRATAFIKVTRSDGLSGSGSGFVESGSKMVMTNAHVVGMLSPSAPPPTKIEVIFNSGLPDEKNYTGTVFGVDRDSDLALLRITNVPAGQALPEPLQVVTAEGLIETQKVYVFGFPLGESLGKAITVSPSAISSLRRAPGGEIERVQVNGGMQPGNSGGPVVDDKGNVVGVAVAIIKATNLNFAIPGNVVHDLLKGRVSGTVAGEPMRKGTQVAVPVTVTLINPLQKIRTVEVEWWLAPGGLKPNEVEAKKANAQVISASYSPGATEAIAEVVMANVPPAGQELYVRAIVGADGTKKSHAIVNRVVDEPPEPKATTMVVRFIPGQRNVKLFTTLKMKIDANESKVANWLWNMNGTLQENVQANGFHSYGVQHFEMGAWINEKQVPLPARVGSAFKSGFPKLGMTVQLDAQNNIVKSNVDVRQIPGNDAKDIVGSVGDQLVQSLELITISTPGNGTLQPNQTWNGTRKVSLDTLGMIDMLDSQNGTLDIVYTYRGLRKVGGRDLPVISIRGRLRGEKGKGLDLSGDVNGEVALDPNSGTSLSGKVSLRMITEIKVRDKGTLQSTGQLDITIQR